MGKGLSIPPPVQSLVVPQMRAYNSIISSILGGYNVVLQSPTGSGKTRIACEVLRWAKNHRSGGIFYVNRKSLVSQTSKSFSDGGLSHGIRAADHEEKYEPWHPVQIASADTERVRVYGDNPCWSRHDAGVVIIDEMHIQKGLTMQNIIADHESSGAAIVALSATPVALAGLIGNAVLVPSGAIHEFRAAGLLVPAVCKSIEQPDLRKVKRNLTGEFVLNDQVKRIYTQQIVGNVIDRWKKYNPDARPTMLYAPGKPESVWLCKQLNDAGVQWCHVDATEAYYDGKRYNLTRSLWEDILGKYKDGTFKGISSRFKLREGVDVPSTYHIILATPIGSLASYLQTVGRGLRAAPGKDHCLITDHGGNYLRHGSPNHDRDWELLFRLSSGAASKIHVDSIRNGEIKEPIRCPNCEGERLAGINCPHCGHTHAKSTRNVLQANGKMVTKEGNMIPKKRVLMQNNTQRLWDNMYFGFKKKKVNRTFAQMEAFFVSENGYWPPRTLNNQPLNPVHWHSVVADVPMEDLRLKEK